MCTEEFKNHLKNSINLKDFASRHYGVQWNGNKALCCFPGHNEKTESLHYKEENNYVSCFGHCQETAVDIFKFVGIMENLDTFKDFPEIIKKICDMEGINMPTNKAKPINQEYLALMQKKTKLATEFIDGLQKNKGGEAYNYLLNRGLTDETIKLFQLGATKVDYDRRYSSFIGKSEEKINLINLNNRVTIPILNPKGNLVIGISFRDLNPDNKNFKYIHDSADAVFHKSKIFYGYSHAADFIRKRNHAYVVEGYFDMMSMYQAGMENTLACMTSEMSDFQLKLLRGLTSNITVIIDQDKAGVNGFKRTLQAMLTYGFKVKIVSSLDYNGKDINEMCNKLKWNKDEINFIINNNSKDGVLYMISTLLDKYDEKMLEIRSDVMRASITYINTIDDEIIRNNYKSYVSKRLSL